MGKRANQQRQEPICIPQAELPQTVPHPFYTRLNQVLEDRGFDEFVEARCAPICAERMGRRSLASGRYFRMLLIGVLFCPERLRPLFCGGRSIFYFGAYARKVH